MKILIAYDGTLHAKKALKYGIEKLQIAAGEMTVLQVFDPSLFVDYDAGPRAEEMARSECSRQLEEAGQIIGEKAAGILVNVVAEEGDAIRKIAGHIAAEHPDLILVPPRYREIAKGSDRPVMLIPGIILVPVDNTGTPVAILENIVHEAAATGSKVLLLGIVPIHLYSREERKELERVRKETISSVKDLRRTLSAKGIETLESMRAGYPDEEILKAASEHAVSLILLPSGGTTPSELSKAAAILLDESERTKWPVSLLPAAGAV